MYRRGRCSSRTVRQDQLLLLPPSLEELIPSGHAVRVVSDAVDRMDLDSLLSSYDGGGASRYHPRMLLKVVLYGYLDGVRSLRRLVEAEAMFGQIKHNGNFRRFLLHGLDKVKTGFHLVATAHNLKKLLAAIAPCPT